MEKGKVAGTAPIQVAMEQGKKYAYCTCGESSKQPFCDGAHKGSAFSPTVFVAEEDKTVHFCTCKQTSNPSGFCNGAHKSL